VCQGGEIIATKTMPWPASPGRMFRVPANVLASVDATGGPVPLALL
jgi:hypothetical protein